MQLADPLRLGLRRLQSRFRLTDSPRWLRRVGSFRHTPRQRHVPAPCKAEAVSPPFGHARSRPPASLPGVLVTSLNKREKQATLSRILALDLARGAEMATEAVLSPGQSDHDLLEG